MPKSNVYTRTGDAGTTSLVGGSRVAKNNPRLEAYGTVDEANSWLGLLDASQSIPAPAHVTLGRAMNHLFDIGASLATEPESKWQPEPFPADGFGDLPNAFKRPGRFHSCRSRDYEVHQPSERLSLHFKPRD